MAASLSPIFRSSNMEPFTHDPWSLVFKWELQDGVPAFLERNGNEFRYKITGDTHDIITPLLYKGDPEQFLNLITKMRPLRIGDQLKFVNQLVNEYDIHESQLSDMDKTKTVTKDVWALTLVSQLSEGNNTYGMTSLIGGHAYILIEMINRVGIFEKLRAHIFIRNNHYPDIPKGYAKPNIDYREYNPAWPKTDTYLRPAIEVQKMIDDVLQQKKQYEYSIAQNHRPPIRFDAKSPIPEDRIHNCLTWCLTAFKIVDINIPLIKFPLPGSTPWYIPRYHIRSIRAICESLAKDDIDVTPYVPEQVALEIKKDERNIEEGKRTLRILVGAIPGSIFIPGCQIFLPVTLTVYPVASAYCGYKINQMEKALARKKYDHLLNYFKEQ